MQARRELHCYKTVLAVRVFWGRFCGAIQDPLGDRGNRAILKPVSMAAEIGKTVPKAFRSTTNQPRNP